MADALGNKRYSSKIIKAGALLPDTKLLLETWETDTDVENNLERVREENLLGKSSRSRVEDVLRVFRQRYLEDPEVLRALVTLVKGGMFAESLDRILYVQAVRSDLLLHDLVVEVLADWSTRSDREVRTWEVRGNELLLTHSEMEQLSDRANDQMDLFDVSQVTDEEFWQRAEEQVIEALRSYSDEAAYGMSYQRRLFADDAAQGFAFVDICRKRFDVVLMNPPFGDASKPSKAYIEKNYPRTKNDVYAAFVERGLDWLHPGGLLGAITSRTGFFLSSFRKWREEIILKEARPTVVADLGQGALDTAMVETAAYALEKSR